jgi:hypothetical protein
MKRIFKNFGKTNDTLGSKAAGRTTVSVQRNEPLVVLLMINRLSLLILVSLRMLRMYSYLAALL